MFRLLSPCWSRRVINLVLASISSPPSRPVQPRPTFSTPTASRTSPSCLLLTLLSWPPAPVCTCLIYQVGELSSAAPNTSIFLIPSTPGTSLSSSRSLRPPSLPQVAPVPASRASSWLMSSLGPELCQGAWRCSGQTGRASGGPWWSLGTDYGHWRRDRKGPECPTCRYPVSVSVPGASDCYFVH